MPRPIPPFLPLSVRRACVQVVVVVEAQEQMEPRLPLLRAPRLARNPAGQGEVRTHQTLADQAAPTVLQVQAVPCCLASTN